MSDIDFSLLVGAGAPVREFKAGDVIFSEGDPAEELFVVQTGRVEIRVGKDVFETVPEHGIFGEMALIGNAPRSANAGSGSPRAQTAAVPASFLNKGTNGC